MKTMIVVFLLMLAAAIGARFIQPDPATKTKPALFIIDVDPVWPGLIDLLENLRESNPGGRVLVIGAAIPKEIAQSRKLQIELRTPKSTTPKALKMNEDARILGVACYELEITEE